MPRQGLHDPAQVANANEWVRAQIAQAEQFMENPLTVGGIGPNGEFLTLARCQQLEAERTASNPFYARVKETYTAHAANIARYTPDSEPWRAAIALRAQDINTLRTDSQAALVRGREPPGFASVVQQAFNSFDIWSPFQSVGRVVSALIRGTALMFGGDAAAPWIRSAKSWLFSKFDRNTRYETVAEAEAALRYENGGEELATVLRVSDREGFGRLVGTRLRDAANPVSPLQPGRVYASNAPEVQSVVNAATSFIPAGSSVVAIDDNTVLVGSNTTGQFIVSSMLRKVGTSYIQLNNQEVMNQSFPIQGTTLTADALGRLRAQAARNYDATGNLTEQPTPMSLAQSLFATGQVALVGSPIVTPPATPDEGAEVSFIIAPQANGSTTPNTAVQRRVTGRMRTDGSLLVTNIEESQNGGQWVAMPRTATPIVLAHVGTGLEFNPARLTPALAQASRDISSSLLGMAPGGIGGLPFNIAPIDIRLLH